MGTFREGNLGGMKVPGRLPDLSEFGVQDLLRLEDAVIAEFRRRGLVRTNNKPLGDIAEQVVLAARGGVIEPNSTKSHDVTTGSGQRIQVKAMGGRTAGRAAVFSPFRSFEFDTAIFLVFAADNYELVLAREVAVAEVEAVGRWSQHVNGRLVALRNVETLGVDVTEEMGVAYAALDADRGDGPAMGAGRGPGSVTRY